MTRYWQDLQPGECFRTDNLMLAEREILAFAGEFDPQPYHLDREAASQSIFGGLCASGWQVTALTMRLLTEALRREQIAMLGVVKVPSLRWKLPVMAGDSLCAEISVLTLDPASRMPGAGSVEVQVHVANQDAKPVIELSAQLMVAHREAAHG